MTLKTFNKTKVCQGSSRKLSNLKSSKGYKFVKPCGIRRQLKCNTIIEKNIESSKNRLEILEIKKLNFTQLLLLYYIFQFYF